MKGLNMKQLLVCFTLILFVSCVSTRTRQADEQLSVDPLVIKWIKVHKNKPDDQIAIMVKSSRLLTKYPFLHQTGENSYTANVNISQLKRLLLDPYIKRISAGKQKLYNAPRPMAPAEPKK